MSGAYLDTTIVIDLAVDPRSPKVNAILYGKVPVEYPFYAVREMLAGYIRTLCELHNRVLAADNVGQAILAISVMSTHQPRQKQLALQQFGERLDDRSRRDPNASHATLLTETRRDLALEITRRWDHVRHPKKGDLVQPLACFSATGLRFGDGGELRGASTGFNCDQHERCSAAAYLHERTGSLSKMIDALLPENIAKELADKRETISRRRALKELQKDGSSKFNKRYCRAIGDAYFAAMCPPGSVLITTNTNDFEPLCAALGNKVEKP